MTSNESNDKTELRKQAEYVRQRRKCQLLIRFLCLANFRGRNGAIPTKVCRYALEEMVFPLFKRRVSERDRRVVLLSLHIMV